MKRDLRKYAESTTFRLILGGAILIFIIATVLIGIFYGTNAALFGLICLFAAALPIGLIALIIIAINKVVEKERKKQE